MSENDVNSNGLLCERCRRSAKLVEKKTPHATQLFMSYAHCSGFTAGAFTTVHSFSSTQMFLEENPLTNPLHA